MNIAIIDDQYEEHVNLTAHIKRYFAKTRINLPLNVNSFENENDFFHIFTKGRFEIIFIDYYLKNYTGMELARKIREVDSSVILIFITVSRDFAIDSYKVKSSGYLLKPLIYDDFAEIMSLIDHKKFRDRRYIELENGTENIRILIKSIVYCDVVGHYTQIHLKNNQMERCRVPLLEIKNKLMPYPEFFQCYRGCIINMLYIDKVDELSFIMADGSYIPFRKKQKSEILKTYSDFLFEVVMNEG